MKQTLKSIAVLCAIAFVCVAILAVANTYLKKEITLDKQTCAILNSICPSGVEDETAYNDGYFVMLTNAQLSEGANGYSIADYKKSANNLVQAIYYARKGNSEGKFIIEVKSAGYYEMTLLIAFETDGNDFQIFAVAPKDVREDNNFKQVFNPEYFEKFVDYVKGKNVGASEDEIKIATGATTKNSIRGLSEGLSLAVEAMNGLYSHAQGVKDIVNANGEGSNG